MSAPQPLPCSLPTISTLSAPRARTGKKANAKQYNKLHEVIKGLLDEILACCVEIGVEFDKKPHWVEDQVFYGGQHLLSKHDGNVYNMFIHFKSQELEEESELSTHDAVDVDECFAIEYQQLSEADKKELVQWHNEEKLMQPLM
ncbi:hypothetical protein FISHEDRAFT_78913 [Fistulina hepatica ATCC 64428]|uniref:Uncharacterized protein n=1 Tax=Fistulina hepatica ATCC 64428 TaxID=1128425 RepID=A0A0D7A268_9AGAR|nr:hypothetical protein FISHEDRAFT_78913 [Fistulina hepatica ATCC 64428]